MQTTLWKSNQKIERGSHSVSITINLCDAKDKGRSQEKRVIKISPFSEL